MVNDMSQDKSESNKDRKVGYLVYPWSLDHLATADKVLPLLERLHYLGFATIVSPVYLKTTNYFTFDLQISYALIKKCDVLLLVEEEHMTETMLRELHKGREYKKPVIRIGRKAE